MTLGIQIPHLPRTAATRLELYRAVRLGREDAEAQKCPRIWDRERVGMLLSTMRERFRMFDGRPDLQAVASAAWFHEVSCRVGRDENFFLLSVGTQQMLALAFSLLDSEACLNLLDYAPNASGRGVWQKTWRPICIGALAQAHVIAALTEWRSGCCKLPHLIDDAFGAIDLICGPFARGQALCLQVKSSRLTRFQIVTEPPPPPQSSREDAFRDERALWRGTAHFNRKHRTRWGCALVLVDMRELPVDTASVKDLRKVLRMLLEPFSKEPQ